MGAGATRSVGHLGDRLDRPTVESLLGDKFNAARWAELEDRATGTISRDALLGEIQIHSHHFPPDSPALRDAAAPGGGKRNDADGDSKRDNDDDDDDDKQNRGSEGIHSEHYPPNFQLTRAARSRSQDSS
jgi:hypothetical protein